MKPSFCAAKAPSASCSLMLKHAHAITFERYQPIRSLSHPSGCPNKAVHRDPINPMSLKVQDKVARPGARESGVGEMTPEWVKSHSAYGCVLGHENAILSPQNQNQDSLVRSDSTGQNRPGLGEALMGDAIISSPPCAVSRVPCTVVQLQMLWPATSS
jgi:hypothetical protein